MINGSIETLSPHEIYKTLQSFANYRIAPHEEYMNNVEPHVLKYIEVYNPEQIAYILTYYCKIRAGSEQWLRVLIS